METLNKAVAISTLLVIRSAAGVAAAEPMVSNVHQQIVNGNVVPKGQLQVHGRLAT
jgi:hypothetical protein